MNSRRAFAPGRVNLIGDHTDYAGGRALPMAIDLGTTAIFDQRDHGLSIESDLASQHFELGPSITFDPGTFPAFITSLAGLLGWPTGELRISSNLPIGSGLSSSASLLIAAAMAMGAQQQSVDLARLCQEAERLAGQDVGLLDQIAIIEGREDHAIEIDFASLIWHPVSIPSSAEIVIIDSGERRSLATGAYGDRRREVAEAEAIIGPLGQARSLDVEHIVDPVCRRRALHVITESNRVDAVAELLGQGRFAEVGELLLESHRSLSKDFEVSTPGIDALVDELAAHSGVHGVRLTGGGFGGCVVALVEPGSLDRLDHRHWVVAPSMGARILSDD